LRRHRTSATPRPAPSDLILLAYPGLIGEPDLKGLSLDTLVLREACQRGREFFTLLLRFLLVDIRIVGSQGAELV